MAANKTIASLVYDYLMKTDFSLAQVFQKKTKAVSDHFYYLTTLPVISRSLPKPCAHLTRGSCDREFFKYCVFLFSLLSVHNSLTTRQLFRRCSSVSLLTS